MSARGFSVIKLLIVIVVVALLAAIVFVVYNRISASTSSKSAKDAAASLQKKVKTFDQSKGYYPGDATNSSANKSLSDLNSFKPSALTGTAISIGVSNAKNGQTTLEYQICDKPSGATGYKIYWWDYSVNALTSTPYSGGSSITPCTHYTVGS